MRSICFFFAYLVTFLPAVFHRCTVPTSSLLAISWSWIGVSGEAGTAIFSTGYLGDRSLRFFAGVIGGGHRTGGSQQAPLFSIEV
jgi:hypothetical protein